MAICFFFGLYTLKKDIHTYDQEQNTIDDTTAATQHYTMLNIDRILGSTFPGLVYQN
jgi:hypothetical protein